MTISDPFPPYTLILNFEYNEEKSFGKTFWKKIELLILSKFHFFSPQCFQCNLYLNSFNPFPNDKF